MALTLLDISGSSYPAQRSGVTFDPGIPFGLRVGTAIARRIRWWLDALITLWPRDQEVVRPGLCPGPPTLPRGGGLVGLGRLYGGR